MNIKESKFFTQRDISLLKALGYKNPTVETYNAKTEEIDLGEGVFLLANIAPCGLPHYWVRDCECNDRYLSERDVLGAIFRYHHEDMYQRNYHDSKRIPDFFRPWEVNNLLCTFSVNRELAKRNPSAVFNDSKRIPVYVESWTTYYVSENVTKFFALVTDGKKLKIAIDPFKGEYPEPETLPEYNKWEPAKDKDGNLLEISLGNKIFGNSGWTGKERTRLLNIKVKKLDDRGIKP